MPEDTQHAPRSFSVFLSQCREGELHAECSAQLAKLLGELDRVAKSTNVAKGSLTLSLAFKLEAGVVEVTGDVKIKEPKLPTGKAVFWLDDKHHLVTENPRQQKIPIRDVSAPAPARDVIASAEVGHG